MRRFPANLKKQAGAGFIALMFYFAVAGVVVLLGLKIVPAYLDYFTVKKILASMSHGEEMRSGTVTD
ncbi:MAG TPA: hypothetical protein VFV17_10535, partial [Usitatibacteraceae bacterium]|nr:hypothetical protein [Usitatibacteraceae bacterium]